MKFSEWWLRQYVNPALDSAALAHLLTMGGLEVEAVVPVAADFSGVVVGLVRAVAAHPAADRLKVCQVDAGTGELLQIVCGASNVAEGVRVPCARVGAQLPGMEIRAAKLRGVDSFGMLCSARELGMAENADGLLLLPAEAPIGLSVREYLHLDDRVFTLKMTPNRSDCLSVQGIAREVAAMTGATLASPPALPVNVSGEPGIALGAVDAEACPRYMAQRLEGLNPASPTPDWMRERLQRSGLRSLGAIVDVTNYVLLETGQPLHAFDADRLTGAIQVRWAHADERIALLNGQEIGLDPDMLVIADGRGAQALAGIMGGAASAVSDATTAVVLESAFFHPDAISGRARRLGMSTDASYRFERGVDFAALDQALNRAAGLLLSICGGSARPVVEITQDLPRRPRINLRRARATRILGIALDHATIGDYLRRLGCNILETETGYDVVAPSWRFDLSLEVDLIEELARLHGYDQIAPQVPVAALSMLAQPEQVRDTSLLRDILVARDYQEVLTYSFVDAAWERELGHGQPCVVLKNPIASQMGVMRTTLLGGLIDVLDSNLNRGQTRVRIMEIGRCYLGTDSGFSEPLRLGGLVYGSTASEQWDIAARTADFFDVKADLEALCWPQGLRVEVGGAHPALHPGQSAQIVLEGCVIGWLGVLHPAVVQRKQWAVAPVVFELELPALLARRLPQYQPLCRFQSVRRDLAVIVDLSLNVQTVLDTLRAARVNFVTEIALFDSYRGKHIDYDKKSLAFSVLMQDNHKTLTDSEVDGALTQLTLLLQQQFGAQLRS